MVTDSQGSATQTQIYFLAFIRWANNINQRMIYPFISTFARGMGVDILAISLVASVRFLLAMFSPLLASIADYFGRRTAMMIGIAVFTASVITVFLIPTYPVFFVTHCTAFAGSYLILTSIQAYIGDHVPYARRGAAVGTTELGWSMAFLLGMPLVAFLIARFGWRAPFPLLALLGVLIIIGLLKLIPDDKPRTRAAGFSFRSVLSLLKLPIVRVALGMTVMLGIYSETIFMIFGLWMEDSFGLLIAGLGFASATLGVAELVGEFMTMRISDRIGKGRSIQAGVLLSTLSALFLIFIPPTLATSLVGLFFFILGFEFAYVSSVPLMSDIVTTSRAGFLGANAAALAAGRGVATVLSPLIYNYGIRANLILAVVACAGSLLLAYLLIDQRKRAGQEA